MSQQDQGGDSVGKIAVVMGSQSDWPVMKHAVEQLEAFGVPYEAKVVSAHRTPELLFEFAELRRSFKTGRTVHHQLRISQPMVGRTVLVRLKRAVTKLKCLRLIFYF